MASSKKPALALVIASGKSQGDGEDEAPPSSKDMDSEDYEAIVGELADAIGVQDDKRKDFAEAFKAAVTACK